MEQSKDFTPTGVKIEGNYENDRNAASSQLFKDIIREACDGPKDVIIAHHLTYVKVDHRDGFDYQVVEEIPSADALIFDHDIAKKIWGEDDYIQVLKLLAMEPIASRDKMLGALFYSRKTPQWNAKLTASGS